MKGEGNVTKLFTALAEEGTQRKSYTSGAKPVSTMEVYPSQTFAEVQADLLNKIPSLTTVEHLDFLLKLGEAHLAT